MSAMSIFAIIPLGTNSKLAEAVTMQFAAPLSMSLPGGAWLVAGQGTAQDVSNRIGITDGHVGSALVVEASSYYGRASPDVWSWVKSNWEGAAIG